MEMTLLTKLFNLVPSDEGYVFAGDVDINIDGEKWFISLGENMNTNNEWIPSIEGSVLENLFARGYILESIEVEVDSSVAYGESRIYDIKGEGAESLQSVLHLIDITKKFMRQLEAVAEVYKSA